MFPHHRMPGEKIMFYKHWKKISLTLTAFFWASCNNTTVEPPLYGCPAEGCGQEPASSSDAIAESSSSGTVSSSSQAQSSSSFEQPQPAYGVVAIPCYQDSKSVKTNDDVTVTNLQCVDGVTCKEREVTTYGSLPCTPIDDGDLKGAVACPDYGIVHITEKTYNCDGVSYNEAEFRSRYFNAGMRTTSSSSEAESSSSAEVTCTPGDSTVSYYPPSYSADIAKMNAEERAKQAGIAHIDSLKENFHAVSRCLNDLRHELSSFIALYGAPNVFPKEEVCSDGTTRLTKEYLDYLQMKEEWEKNKPALDEECQKIYDKKLNEIKQRIDKCFGDSTTTTDLTECDLEVICPDYGIDSKCSGNYRCEDGVRCWDQEKDDTLFIKCSDESGKSVTYTEDEFKAKYHAKF